ncbi:MAG: hypothetical protein J6V40_05480, partial [Clostridia bacterium]|nr:hypothetical protein [Clostridia bacterium]
MEKVAIVELNANELKLHFVDVVKNKSYVIYDTTTMPINLFKDYSEDDNFIKPAVIKDILEILCVFKSMIAEEQVVETLCYATSKISEAKNLNGFINEMFNASGLKFNIMTPEEEINYIYTSVINTFNKPKGIIVNVGNFNTEILVYNRRNILNTLIIPVGDIAVTNKYFTEAKETFYSKIAEEVTKVLDTAEWLKEPYEEFEVIGVGNVFKNIGVLARKASKYPLEVAHNYNMSMDTFSKVYSVISGQEITGSKIKGLPVSDSKSFQGGIAIVNTILNYINKPSVAISNFNQIEGVLFNYAIHLTLEKPIMDVLGYSLQVINDYYNEKRAKCTEKVYNISMILYRQLKVLHKLTNKMYQRVLRIASYMSNSGLRIDLSNADKAAFNLILSSNIYGVNQNEILLAAFVVMAKNADNFNLKE